MATAKLSSLGKLPSHQDFPFADNYQPSRAQVEFSISKLFTRRSPSGRRRELKRKLSSSQAANDSGNLSPHSIAQTPPAFKYSSNPISSSSLFET